MAESTTEAKQETKKRDNQLAVDRCKLEEHTTTRHSVTVEQGTLIEDLDRPDFWAHVGSKFRPFDIITVRTDDGVWWAEALVLTAARAYAKVKVLRHEKLTTGDVEQTQEFILEGHTVKWRGDHLKYSVIRIKDGAVVRDKMETFTAAQVWLTDFVKGPLV